MAESGLSIGYTDLANEIGGFLGYGFDYTAYDVGDLALVDSVLQSGVRQFYYPPADAGMDTSFEWSFLNPVGTVSVVADTTDYDLPDDFGRMNGRFFFNGTDELGSIPIVSYGSLLARRSAGDITARPMVAAMRWKASAGGDGQRHEVVFHPTPDSEYTLSYQYVAYSGKLSVSAPYPLGGMEHAETLIASCLAVADSRINSRREVQWESFMRNLASSVARDRKGGAQNFGQMGRSDIGDDSDYPRHFRSSNYEVTYKGETW
jgi:hypothetical protein